jgi:branched-subunit amino acid aminotransferase/4-amino-4-deoxychorismate lyase
MTATTDAGGQCLVWHGDQLVAGLAEPGTLLAADSWLVDNGRTRALDLHQRRFASSCAELGVRPAELSMFWRRVMDRLPRAGQWFPRAELIDIAGQHRLQVRIRPAPERTNEARVLVTGEPDPRLVPRRKGPDLDRLAALRRAAAHLGAQEVLLATGSGIVLEAANSSLLWWEGEELCVPDPELPVLPGVTAAVVRRLAERNGVPVRHRRRRLSELAGCEVWVANALHGIRPVIEWVHSGQPTGLPVRCPRWRRWWSEFATRLPSRGFQFDPQWRFM